MFYAMQNTSHLLTSGRERSIEPLFEGAAGFEDRRQQEI
jgi:hypothetical protein